MTAGAAARQSVTGDARRHRALSDSARRAAAVLQPRSIVVLGASAREGTLHGRGVANLVEGGYDGEIFPVNPRYQEISGRRCFPDLASVGCAPELALILLNADRVCAAVDECIAAGVRAVVIFAAGFAEIGEAGERLQAELKARGDALVIAGPNLNCIFSQPSRLSLGFGPVLEFAIPDAPRAMIAQSGAVGTAVVTRAAQRGLGFRYVIATGNEIDLGAEDYLAFLADEPEPVRSCLLFLETIRDPLRFAQAAIACRSRGIRLIAYKVGTSERARAVSSSHTAAIAGPIETYRALFAKLGVWSVDTLDELHLCAQLDAWDDRVDGGIGAISFSGGQAAVLADAAERDRLPLAEFTSATTDRLREISGATTIHHPFDCGGQVVADPARWEATLAAVSDQPDVYGLAVALSAVAGGRDRALTDELGALARDGRNVLLMWSSGTDPRSSVPELRDADVPVFDRIEDATACLRIRHTSLSAPAVPDDELAAFVASYSPRSSLPSSDALAESLRQAGVSIPAEFECDSVDGVLAAFASVGGTVALKAPRLLHKSDRAGVVLGLDDADHVRAAATTLAAAHGFPVLLQQQVSGRRELLIGSSRSEVGVAIVIGTGGILTELIGDTATLLAPVGPEEVRAALTQLKAGRLLVGYRGLAPADAEVIVAAACALAKFALDYPAVASIDLNPVIVSDDGASFWAVDRKLVFEDAR
jgi:acyl-CoA synthetase (NDP forming)